jgi:hypothetical protein
MLGIVGTAEDDAMTWYYEPDPRGKHKRDWTEDTAGFVEGDAGELIGKCPSGMSMETA